MEKSETDCPMCPECGRMAVEPAHSAAYAVDRTHTLRCSACGFSWRGLVGEVARAKRAQEAWDAQPNNPDNGWRQADAILDREAEESESRA